MSTSFGGDGSAKITIDGGLKAYSKLTFWTARTGGAQVGGLVLASTGQTTDTITTERRGGVPAFTDPANHLELFADQGAGAERVRVDADPAATYFPVQGAATATTAPAAGAAAALPATPAGYVTVVINGTSRQIAYY